MVVGLQGLDNNENCNSIEVSLDSNSLMNELFKYKQYEYWFIIKNLLFSSSVKNNTQVIFISCDRLKDAKETFINSKLYKTLGVVYLNKIKNWDAKTKHFAFGFSTQNVSNLLKFYITLIDDKGEHIEFEKN